MSTDTAVPFVVMTKTLPVVGFNAEIEEIGITKEVPLVDDTRISLFLQNFTVIGVRPKPAPVIVKLPPAESERFVVESPEIVGA